MNARTVTAVSVLGACVLGLGLYMVKYRVLDLKDSLASVNGAVAAEREALHVLKAEWSLLNDPARLGGLSARLLGMTPVAAGQIKPLEALPLRVPEDEKSGAENAAAPAAPAAESGAEPESGA